MKELIQAYKNGSDKTIRPQFVLTMADCYDVMSYAKDFNVDEVFAALGEVKEIRNCGFRPAIEDGYVSLFLHGPRCSLEAVQDAVDIDSEFVKWEELHLTWKDHERPEKN